MTFLTGVAVGMSICLALLLLALRAMTQALRARHDELVALIEADAGSWKGPCAPIDTPRAPGQDGTQDPAGPEEGEEA